MPPLLVTQLVQDRLAPKQGSRRRTLTRKILLGVTVLVAVAVLVAAVVVQRGITLPAPTGPHAVGRTTYRWIDTARPEGMTDAPDDQRAVVVHIWYPAEADGDAASYLPDVQELRPSLAASSEFGWLKAWAVTRVHGYSRSAAPVAGGQAAYPVLVFLPGNRTNAGLYTTLLEELASHGYVVAAIDHPYDVEAVLLPDGLTAVFAEHRWPAPVAGTEAALSAFYRERVNVRAEDAVFVLGQLERLNTETSGLLAGRLDLTRVGVLGHSVGGVAAPRACQMDTRFAACVNLDGLAGTLPFYADETGRGPAQPFLLLTKPMPQPSEADLARWGLTRSEWEALAAGTEAELKALLGTVAGGSTRVTIADARHESFTDTPVLDGAAPVERRHMDLVRAYVRAFFDEHLRGQVGALDGVPVEAAVRVEVFGGK